MNALPSTSTLHRPQDHDVVEMTSKVENARITSVALAVIALIILTTAMGFFAASMLPPVTLSGLGALLSLSAIFLSWVGAGILLGSVGFGVHAAVCFSKRNNF